MTGRLTTLLVILLLSAHCGVQANNLTVLLDAFQFYAFEYENTSYTRGTSSQATYGSSGASYLQSLNGITSPRAENLSDSSDFINDLAIALNVRNRAELNFAGETAFNNFTTELFDFICEEPIDCSELEGSPDIYRTLDGTCNNWNNPLWGAAFTAEPRFGRSRGSWERMATTEINLTETNYMIDTSYIGATPDFGRKPFLVKARGDAGLRISVFANNFEEEPVSCESAPCTRQVNGIIQRLRGQGKDCVIGKDLIYNRGSNTIEIPSNANTICLNRTLNITFHPFIADIFIQPTSVSDASRISVDGSTQDTSQAQKFGSTTIKRYWVYFPTDTSIIVTQGTEFSRNATFMSATLSASVNLNQVYVAVGKDIGGTNTTAGFAIRDTYQVTTDLLRPALSYGIHEYLDRIPWTYANYVLRFGVRQGPNKRGPYSIILYSGSDFVNITLNDGNPTSSTIRLNNGTSAATFNSSAFKSIRFETAAGQNFNVFNATWIAWFKTFVSVGFGNQIGRNLAAIVNLTSLTHDLSVKRVGLNSTDITRWVFDIEQINTPRKSSLSTGEPLKSAFTIAHLLHTNRENTTKWSTRLTMAAFQFGQFFDHDAIFTAIMTVNGSQPQCCVNGQVVDEDNYDEEACFEISVTDDILNTTQLEPFNINVIGCMNLVRSGHVLDCSTPDEEVDHRIRQPINTITSYIDGSNVYGSTDEELAHLLDSDGIHLHILNNPVTGEAELPIAPEGAGEACFVDTDIVVSGQNVSCREAGDHRSQEQPLLNAIHTLFVREHNRIVDELLANHGYSNATATDRQKLFNVTRSIVWAEIQVITYKEFLPSFMSNATIAEHRLEYNSRCRYRNDSNGGAFNEFGLAFRFGHSWIPNNFGGSSTEPNRFSDAINSLSLADNYFVPTASFANGSSDLLLNFGKACPATDRFIEDAAQVSLFGNMPGTVAQSSLSLSALNDQRGRDHGSETWLELRSAFDKTNPATNFDDLRAKNITSEEVDYLLRQVYDSAEDVDTFTAVMIENPVDNTVEIGSTLSFYLGEMFDRLKRFDRFWYSCYFNKEATAALQTVTLGQILCDNVKGFDTNSSQTNIFNLENSLTNPLVSCADRTKLDLALFNNSNNGGRAPDFTNNIAISSKRNNVHLEQTIKGQAASDLYEIEKLVDQLKRLVVDTQDEEDQK